MEVMGRLVESEVAHRPGDVLKDIGYQGMLGHDVKLWGDLDEKGSTLGRGGRSAQVWYFSFSLNSRFHSLTLSTSWLYAIVLLNSFAGMEMEEIL